MFDIIVLCYGIVIFLVSWLTPLPYGRFCDTIVIPKLLSLPNIISWSLCNLPAFAVLFYELLIQEKRPIGLGLVLNVLFFIHFFWRALISQIFIFMIKSTPDKKKISVFVLLLLGSYNLFVGLNLAKLCRVITREVEGFDYPFVIGAGLCLLLNAFYDIYVNYRRNDDDCVMYIEGLGHYLSEETLCRHFKLLHSFGITSPNYFFEVCEWFFVALLTLHTESMFYFLATLLILWVRAYNINLWHTETDNK